MRRTGAGVLASTRPTGCSSDAVARRLCNDRRVSLRPLGTEAFDAFVDGLDRPMFVVTVAHDGQRAGCLVGFATQVSIDPPRILVCLSVQNHTYRVASDASLLAVHVLGQHQVALAELFGAVTGDDTDKLSHCSWHAGPSGVPLLDDCSRRLVGRVLQRVPFGDHVGFLLEPVEVEARGTAPALSLEQVDDLDPGHQA